MCFFHITHCQSDCCGCSSLPLPVLDQALSSEAAAGMSAALVTHKHVHLDVWRASPLLRVVKTTAKALILM